MQLTFYEIEAQPTSNRVILKTKLSFYSYPVTFSMKIRAFPINDCKTKAGCRLCVSGVSQPLFVLFSPVQVEISSLTAESQSYQQQVSEVLFQYCVSSEAEVLFALKL